MLGYVMVQHFPRGTNLLKPGFHMIATIAVIAAITGEWFPYDRCDRLTFFSDRGDHMETRLCYKDDKQQR